MKNRILKFLYNQNKRLFYDFFVEDFIIEIPKDVREPAMEWLGKGRGVVEKWALYQAHLLQRRVVAEPKEIHFYQGMLAMVRLLLVHTVQGSRIIEPVIMGEIEPEKINHEQEVVSATKDLKDFFRTPKKNREELRTKIVADRKKNTPEKKEG